MQTATAIQPRRTFQELRDFAYTAELFKLNRQAFPEVPAKTALQYIRDDQGCLNLRQYVCRHDWNMSPGEADECCGRILCVKCGMDGDA